MRELPVVPKEELLHSQVPAVTPEGFGYDPIFLLPERDRTMAELNTDEKNRLSARGKALAELHKFLTSS